MCAYNLHTNDTIGFIRLDGCLHQADRCDDDFGCRILELPAVPVLINACTRRHQMRSNVQISVIAISLLHCALKCS